MIDETKATTCKLAYYDKSFLVTLNHTELIQTPKNDRIVSLLILMIVPARFIIVDSTPLGITFATIILDGSDLKPPSSVPANVWDMK